MNIEPTIAFLCRGVREPTVQDWRKIKHLLQYINGTFGFPRIFLANLHLLFYDALPEPSEDGVYPRILPLQSFAEMLIYVDASHASHDDARGQTGGCITMGTGVIHSRSSKQK